jgi:hypothetical protein
MNFKSILIVLFLIGSISTSFAQQIQMPQASPSAKIAQQVGLSNVTVDYSRPSTKGRKIFGELVPFGEIWRTGANGATLLTFSTDVIISGTNVPAGQYALYAIPNKSEWTMILSKNTTLWGPIGYNESDDLLRFNVTPNKLSRNYETMEITFADMTDTGANLSIKWETTRVDFRIETEVYEIVMAQIQELVIDTQTENPGLLYAAANYYYTNKKDMSQAYAWISKSVESDKKYWTVHLKAKIEATLGLKTEATASAKESMALAKEAGNPDYIALNERLIKSLK